MSRIKPDQYPTLAIIISSILLNLWVSDSTEHLLPDYNKPQEYKIPFGSRETLNNLPSFRTSKMDPKDMAQLHRSHQHAHRRIAATGYTYPRMLSAGRYDAAMYDPYYRFHRFHRRGGKGRLILFGLLGGGAYYWWSTSQQSQPQQQQQ